MYEPQRAYLYLVDGRGQTFTDAAGLTSRGFCLLPTPPELHRVSRVASAMRHQQLPLDRNSSDAVMWSLSSSCKAFKMRFTTSTNRRLCPSRRPQKNVQRPIIM